MKFLIDQEYVNSPTGQNISNNNKLDLKQNNYLMANHFKNSNKFLNKLTSASDQYSNYNNGLIY